MTTILLLIAMACAALPALVLAEATPVANPQGPVLQATTEARINFPLGIELEADLAWDDELDSGELELLYTVAGDETASLVFVPADLQPGDTSIHVETMIDLQSEFVPSGVTIDYWWRIAGENGVAAESAPAQIQWYDNRWDWQQIDSAQVHVHSYGVDADFAAKILESAQDTVTELERRYELDRSQPLEIWVYPSYEDFQGSQQPNSRESVAGASYPGYFLIVAVIPDGDDGEIGRIIPHEVSHQVLYQATENPFTYPPLWFDEGMATHFQIGGTDGYPGMVRSALDGDVLFNLNSLTVSFPYQPQQATLAYAASWSAIDYIEETYGDDGIAALIAAFGTGLPYDAAIEAALGIDSGQLNAEWTAWIAAQTS